MGKGKAGFVYLDISKESNARVMEFFSLKAEDGIRFRVIKMAKEMQKFKSEFTEFTEGNFATFVQEVLGCKGQRHLMTEDIPEDWDKEPVKVLVGKNFEEIALDATKDVLVEFYAPWCGHCKALAPIYDELGAHFKDNENVVIAKIDATKNEVSLVDVQGFPTLYLFKSEDNKAIQYNGGRTLEAMTAFVETKGEVQKDEEEDEEGEEDEGEEEEEADDAHDELETLKEIVLLLLLRTTSFISLNKYWYFCLVCNENVIICSPCPKNCKNVIKVL